MMGSPLDADDAVQETLVRAWRNLDRFDNRASLRTWLYRIATHVCLDMLSESRLRARPMECGPASTVDDELIALPRTHWLEPIPDVRAIPADATPFERMAMRQSIRLAFMAALQRLPPRQRATLILGEVLGWSAAEIARCLDTSVAAVNSALQRARGALEARGEPDVGALTDAQAKLLDRYVVAFENYDIDSLVALLHEDATLSMPPYTLWLRGPQAIATWLLGRGCGCHGSRLLPTAACGLPAFAQYRPNPEGGHSPWALIVLELAEERISGWNSFLDTERLFPLFGLPPRLEGRGTAEDFFSGHR